MEKTIPTKLKQNLGKRFFCLFLFSFLLAFFSFNTVAAAVASLYFSPSSGDYYQGENFTISIRVKTDVAINAIEGVFSFPTQYLEAIRISKRDSIINLWIQEPSFSNLGKFGNVSFEGVILNPGFTGLAGKVIDVVFLVKNKGAAELEFLRTAILANDGFGTNVTALNGKANFVLLPPKIQPEDQKEEKPPAEIGQQQIIVLREISPSLPRGIESILSIWNTLPSWLKVGVLVFVGIAILISSFILLSFGIIILIYLWRYAFSKRQVVLTRLRLLLKFSWYIIKSAIRKVLAWAKITGKEFESDIKYSLEELKADFKAVTSSPQPSFSKVVKDYWFSIARIIKRFLTRNISPSDLGQSDQGGNEPNI